VHDEVVWVGVAGVGIAIVDVWARVGLAVVEDDDFVDAEDGEGAGDLAR